MNKSNTWRKRKGCFFAFIPLIIFALAAIVMLLWNAILPDVMPVSKITYWQALGILVLSKILFGGFRMGSRFKNHHTQMQQNFKDKFMNMSDEERSSFRAQWKSRCKKD